MVKTATLVKILRESGRKGNVFDGTTGSGDSPMSRVRDHYARINLFLSKKHGKSEYQPFVTETVATAAVFAARDSVLGTVDTVAREFITFWMPEIELYLDSCNHGRQDKATYLGIVAVIKSDTIAIMQRLGCKGDENAVQLHDALLELVNVYVHELFALNKDTLSKEEKARFNPARNESRQKSVQEVSTRNTSRIGKRKALLDITPDAGEGDKGLTTSIARLVKGTARTTSNKRSPEHTTRTAVNEPLSEARLLNSAVAWDVADTPDTVSAAVPVRLKSPIKRHFAEAFPEEGPDPADNGSVWDTQQTAKRQKFEVKISNVIELSDGEEVEVVSDEDPVHARRTLKPVSQSRKKSMHVSKVIAIENISTQDDSDVAIPGALKTADDDCILM